MRREAVACYGLRSRCMVVINKFIEKMIANERTGHVQPKNTVYRLTTLVELQSLLELADERVVLLDFTATWCGPCKKLLPMVHQLASRYSNELLVCEVDVDEAPEVVNHHNVNAMPTFIFYRRKMPFHRITGVTMSILESTTSLAVKAVFPSTVEFE